MAANLAFVHLGRQRNEKKVKERANHLDDMTDEELRKGYCFSKANILFILSLRSVDGLHLRMPMVFKKKVKGGQLSYNAQFSFSVLSTL